MTINIYLYKNKDVVPKIVELMVIIINICEVQIYLFNTNNITFDDEKFVSV